MKTQEQEVTVIHSNPEVEPSKMKEADELGSYFHAMLKKSDEAMSGAIPLSKVWEQCVAMHSDNAIIRTNMIQLHVLLQEQLANQRVIMESIREIIANEHQAEKDETYVERMNELMKLNEKTMRTITLISTTIREAKKELSRSEYLERFYIHNSIVTQFFIALSGILVKHLQSDPRKDMILREISKLGRALSLCGGVKNGE